MDHSQRTEIVRLLFLHIWMDLPVADDELGLRGWLDLPSLGQGRSQKSSSTGSFVSDILLLRRRR